LIALNSTTTPAKPTTGLAAPITDDSPIAPFAAEEEGEGEDEGDWALDPEEVVGKVEEVVTPAGLLSLVVIGMKVDAVGIVGCVSVMEEMEVLGEGGTTGVCSCDACVMSEVVAWGTAVSVESVVGAGAAELAPESCNDFGHELLPEENVPFFAKNSQAPAL